MIFLLLLTIGNFRSIYWEIKELCKLRLKYFFNITNLFQFLLVVSTLFVSIYTYKVNVAKIFLLENRDELTDAEEKKIEEELESGDDYKLTVAVSTTLLL